MRDPLPNPGLLLGHVTDDEVARAISAAQRRRSPRRGTEEAVRRLTALARQELEGLQRRQSEPVGRPPSPRPPIPARRSLAQRLALGTALALLLLGLGIAAGAFWALRFGR